MKVIRETEKLDQKDYMEPTLQALGKYFELDMSAVRSYVETHEKSAYYVLAKRLPYDAISAFQAAMEAEDSMIRGSGLRRNTSATIRWAPWPAT